MNLSHGAESITDTMSSAARRALAKYAGSDGDAGLVA